jgi:hypothetical protein
MAAYNPTLIQKALLCTEVCRHVAYGPSYGKQKYNQQRFFSAKIFLPVNGGWIAAPINAAAHPCVPPKQQAGG